MSLAAAVVQNIEMFAGDTPTIEFGPVLDQLGSPVNLTGASIIFQVWAGNNAFAPPLFSLDVGSGIVIPTQTGPAIGTFSATIPASATQNVTSGFTFAGVSGNLYYECRLTQSGVSGCATFGYLTVTAAQLGVGSTPPTPEPASSVLNYLLTGDTEIAGTSPTEDGDLLTVIITQDSFGGHAITWASNFLLAPTGIPADPDTIDIFAFIGFDGNWYLASTPVMGATL